MINTKVKRVRVELELEGDAVYPCDTVRLIARGYGIEIAKEATNVH